MSLDVNIGWSLPQHRPRRHQDRPLPTVAQDGRAQSAAPRRCRNSRGGSAALVGAENAGFGEQRQDTEPGVWVPRADRLPAQEHPRRRGKRRHHCSNGGRALRAGPTRAGLQLGTGRARKP